MYCSKCGKQIPDTSKFCKFCGGKVENAELKSESPSIRKVKPKTIFIGLGVLLIAAIAVNWEDPKVDWMKADNTSDQEQIYYATADDFEYDYNELEGFLGSTKGIRLISYNNTEESVVYIPPEIEGFPVTLIGPDCFENHDEIMFLWVPDTVTAVSARGLWGMPHLLNIFFEGDDISIIGSLYDEDQSPIIVCHKGSALHSKLMNTTIPYTLFEDLETE